MAQRPNERTRRIREMVRDILTSSRRVMSVAELAQHPDMVEQGVDVREVSNTLSNLIAVEKKPFPLRRTYHTSSGSAQKWGYYIEGVTPVLETRSVARPDEALKFPALKALSTLSQGEDVSHPPEFDFNPVEFAPAPETQVTVPPGVKAITLSVGGVSVRIELT